MVSQWRSSVNLHNWNTGTPLESHWKNTGSALETHWLPTILSPVAFQCTLGLSSRHTGLPLEYHWLRVEVCPFQDTQYLEALSEHKLSQMLSFRGMQWSSQKKNCQESPSRLMKPKTPQNLTHCSLHHFLYMMKMS